MRGATGGRVRALAVFISAVYVMLGVVPMPATAVGTDSHAIVFNGTTSIFQQCEYEWKLSGGEPERDDANIPRPVMYADGPHCRDANPSLPGVQPKSCSLARNTGPYPPPSRANNPDLTKGEVGLYPPCMGKLSASDNPGEAGCLDVGVSASGAPISGTCNISTPGWFYGYCGQTYGGGENGRLTTADGKVWKILRLGFARGRGTWEVSGKIRQLVGGNETGPVILYRNTVNAAPNQPDQLAACEVGQGLSSIIFGGVLVIPAPPNKIVRPRAGWHWCAQDFIIETALPQGSDGC